MKENEFLNVIKETLSDSSYIGNDCADLKEIGLFVTQDSLVEDVHFELKTTTPFQLGQKAVAVNISDLATTLCNPAYISIGLSVPDSISADFVKEFYRGVDIACQKYHAVVTGGDITSADKVYISVSAIGRRRHDVNISRSYAHVGDFIITTGSYGSSAAGLAALQNGWCVSDDILNSHLVPVARLEEAHEAGKYIENDLAIMDTSDGLADALYKVSKSSNVSINVNFEDIPVSSEVKKLAEEKGVDLKDWVLWGGEDFELLLFVPYFLFATLSSKGFRYVGSVVENTDGEPKVTINDNGNSFVIDEKLFNEKTYNHFGG